MSVSFSLLSQENVTTVGFQFKPIISTKFINSGAAESTTDWIRAEFEAEGGYTMGMVIRRGFTPTLSLETGISYLKRNYGIKVFDIDSLYEGEMQYSMVSYQIPIQGLIYARLTDNLYMNASGGFGLNFLPSDVKTNTFEHRQTTYRTGVVNWFKPSLIANYGFEYRTKKDGYFYLGASFDRPFGELALARATIKRPGGAERSTTSVYTGACLTIDFRYFFHEDPERRKKGKKKR